MKYHFLRYSLLGLAIGLGGTASYGQSEIPFILTARPKNTFSASLRMKSGNAKVNFGAAGEVRARNVRPDAERDDYFFENGTVRHDALRDQTTFSPHGAKREDELPSVNGDPTRYVTDLSHLGSAWEGVVGHFTRYEEGHTRVWGVNSASQIQDGSVVYRDRYADFEGASYDLEGETSPGFELQLNHEFGQIGRKFTWGVTGAFGVTEASANGGGVVNARLHDVRYAFSLQTLPGAGTGLSFPFIPSEPSNKILTETTYLLNNTPTVTETIGSAQVIGSYRLRAGYYNIRVGPYFRWEPFRRLSVSGSAGISMAYLGAEYSSFEQMYTPDFDDQTRPNARFNDRKVDASFDFYGDINLEFWVTYRTGLFIGVLYEKLERFDYVFGTRTASLDIGDGLVIRAGIVYRF